MRRINKKINKAIESLNNDKTYLNLMTDEFWFSGNCELKELDKITMGVRKEEDQIKKLREFYFDNMNALYISNLRKEKNVEELLQIISVREVILGESIRMKYLNSNYDKTRRVILKSNLNNQDLYRLTIKTIKEFYNREIYKVKNMDIKQHSKSIIISILKQSRKFVANKEKEAFYNFKESITREWDLKDYADVILKQA